ncbi:hypothetical protein [Pedobacter agri]|uniref:hypothetical protein n=1 Tax=Pedobacter agri TaxID=454586 RepID=UPI00278180C3|nr:hypothetical protein [Pedobacter agri]MDQ1140116.1 SAM-dependent methyltransferase [Pedobacter agri]
MDPAQLSRDLLTLNESGVIAYINHNRSAIRSMFLMEWDSRANKREFEIVLQTLCTREFSNEQKNGPELQSLFVHLAYYFKRVNIPAYLTTCSSRVVDPYFKLRLDARNKYKKHHTFAEHIDYFPAYLELLTSASYHVEDGNFNELLNDLNEYITFLENFLSEEAFLALKVLVESEELQQQFSLLKQFCERESSTVPGLGVLAYDGTEYEPSIFAGNLFDEKFLADIKARSIPGYPQILLGYPTAAVISHIIGRGQTDFDEQFEDLSAMDRVNLYCYFNMRMHFFSSLSLYNRSQIFEKYYHTAGKIRFVDIGCGPATSGIAFADYIHEKSGQQVVFDYFGIDSSARMLEKASYMLENDIFFDRNERDFFANLYDIHPNKFKNSSCIIINCSYVFASPSLPIQNIADYINQLRVIYQYIPIYILYQNVKLASLNLTYIEFKTLISAYDMEWSNIEIIRYHNQRNSFYAPKEREVYYEIIKLS